MRNPKPESSSIICCSLLALLLVKSFLNFFVFLRHLNNSLSLIWFRLQCCREIFPPYSCLISWRRNPDINLIPYYNCLRQNGNRIRRKFHNQTASLCSNHYSLFPFIYAFSRMLLNSSSNRTVINHFQLKINRNVWGAATKFNFL